MPEFPAYRSLEELDAEEGGDNLPSFEVGLHDIWDGSDLHTRNDPRHPYQRQLVTQLPGSIFIKCKCVDVVHGKWGQGSSENASLIVFSFRFFPRKSGRRIKHAEVEFLFMGKDHSGWDHPEVARISLDGHFSLVPTKRTEEVTKGVEGTAGGGALGLELSSTLKWEQKISQETTDAAHVAGITFAKPDRLPDNGVTWTLAENQTQKKGIPSTLRVGILLKRQDDEEFECSMVLKTSADFKTEWEDKFRQHEGDDKLLFKPSLPPTNTLMKYDTSNLGSFNLADIEQVTMTTIREDAIKTIGG